MAKWFTIILAVLGLTMGIWTVATSKEKLPNPPPSRPPSVNPFSQGIAATGIIEAVSRNIVIAPPESGLVTNVMVKVNEPIKRGDALFELDRRAIDAEIVRLEGALLSAKAELARMESWPRPEDIPPLEADVERAKVEVADLEDQLQRTREMFDKMAATPGELARRQFAVDAAKASLAAAKALLARAKAGPWSQDVTVARARVAQAEAEIRAAKIRADRLTVRSPIDGVVIKRNVEPGQFTSGAITGAGAFVVGDTSTLRVRAQVDEEDAPLLRPDARGVARLRGAVLSEFPLKMVRIEPWAQPKLQITGDSTERVDTRVIEVLFELSRPEKAADTPLFLGQVVDVFIEAPTLATPTSAAPSTQPATHP